jgi:hypothetical protein
VADVIEALLNMGDVMAELWPQDDTPRILLRVLVHFKFGALVRDNEAEKCKIIAEFCDAVLRENASRAVGRDPPLSFRQAKERWSDVAERYTTQGGFGGNRQNKSDGKAGGVGGGQQQQQQRNGGMLVRNRGARYSWNGRQYAVCFDYNRGGCSRKATACGCEDGKGVVFAHVCNYYNNQAGKHCLALHPRVGNH